MNIYFCGSIRGGRQDVAIYQQIVTCLKTYGQVLTEHVAFPELEISECLPLNRSNEDKSFRIFFSFFL